MRHDNRHLPSRSQFILMKFDPSLHQPDLPSRQFASQDFAGFDGELCLLPLILGVDVR